VPWCSGEGRIFELEDLDRVSGLMLLLVVAAASEVLRPRQLFLEQLLVAALLVRKQASPLVVLVGEPQIVNTVCSVARLAEAGRVSRLYPRVGCTFCYA
jgi:hypothetical protein